MKTIILSFALLCAFSLDAAWIDYEAPAFKAVNILDGQEISLQQYRGRIVVLEWMKPTCPYVKKQYSRLYFNNVGYVQYLQDTFTKAPFNVVWITVDSASPDEEGYLSESQWKEWLALEGAKPTVVISDEKKELARLYNVTCTPEYFVVNADGVLVYKGAIDSIRSTNPEDLLKKTNRHFLEMALMQLSEGRPVFTTETIPYGCSLEK